MLITKERERERDWKEEERVPWQPAMNLKQPVRLFETW